MTVEALRGLKYLALRKNTWKILYSEATAAWTSLRLKMKSLTEAVIIMDFKLNDALPLKEQYLRKSMHKREETRYLSRSRICFNEIRIDYVLDSSFMTL